MHIKFVIAFCFAVSAPVAAAADRPPVADPAGTVPAPEYRSAFSTYQPFRDQEPASWRELNDEVGRIGGHIGIFRAEKPAEPKAAAKPAPEKPGHAHH